MYLVTHGDHGTSVSDKIVQKTKNVVNSRFFLRIFFPAHFDHWFHSEKFSGGWWWWWHCNYRAKHLVQTLLLEIEVEFQLTL